MPHLKHGVPELCLQIDRHLGAKLLQVRYMTTIAMHHCVEKPLSLHWPCALQLWYGAGQSLSLLQ